jgi:hypothetical protein
MTQIITALFEKAERAKIVRERNAKSLAEHQLNLARAEHAGDVEGVRIARLGILRCNGVASIMERAAA